MVKKTFYYLKSKFEKYRFLTATIIKKKVKKSDVQRWSKSNSLFDNWNERTVLLSKEILENSKVFEFGAANLFLKSVLANNCQYLHSDIVRRNEDTIIIDLNKIQPDIPEVDYVVFSGVLEYVFDPFSTLDYILHNCNCILFSYASTDNFPKTKFRRSQGWESDLSLIGIEAFAKKNYFNLQLISIWNGQHLFKMFKK